MKTQEKLLTTSQIRDRGWSLSMISRFLGGHDDTRVNPFYRSAAPVKLYVEERVLEVEKREDFQSVLVKAQRRSQASQISAQIRTDALCEEVLTRVRVNDMSYDRLRQKALQHKRRRDQERAIRRDEMLPSDDPAKASEEHIHRWMVNYARHVLSNYDRVRDAYAGKVGVHHAAEAVRSTVLSIIAQKWPELAQAATAADRDI